MKSIRLEIINRKGIKLSAKLEIPANQKPEHYAIFAHCFTCSGNLNAVKNISRTLTLHGFAVLRFDFTGLGSSDGEFADSHFSANISDLIDVHEYMTTHYQAPSLLVGHSLGGAAVIAAGEKLVAVKAVATIGAPASAEHTTQHFSHQIDEIGTKGNVKVNIGGRPFNINHDFVEGFKNVDLLAITKRLKKPLLVLHSPFDKIVGIENAHKIYHHAFHPKSFVSLDDADHLLTKKEDSIYVGNVIGTWVQRYFPRKPSSDVSTEGEQVVGHLNILENNFTTSIYTKNHTFLADEPESVGGDDFGPSPYELLNAGLAACTAMTLKMYARRKKWDLQEVYVYLSHSKKHIQDMDKNIFLDHIDKKLRFVGDLTDVQKNRLKEIASKCPVHKTITSDVVIETSILD
ncbi:MAG: putative OsmC-like protein/esterase/lipase [Maribacter sp.]|jgi:uncharacterized OsmC-like protein/esterase/lipase